MDKPSGRQLYCKTLDGHGCKQRQGCRSASGLTVIPRIEWAEYRLGMGVGSLWVCEANAGAMPATASPSALACRPACSSLPAERSRRGARGALNTSSASPMNTGKANVMSSGCQLKMPLKVRGQEAAGQVAGSAWAACKAHQVPHLVSLLLSSIGLGDKRRPPRHPSTHALHTTRQDSWAGPAVGVGAAASVVRLDGIANDLSSRDGFLTCKTRVQRDKKRGGGGPIHQRSGATTIDVSISKRFPYHDGDRGSNLWARFLPVVQRRHL